LVVLLAVHPAFGQQGETQPEAPPLYSLGDQTMTATLGLFVPLFFLSYQPAVIPTNLTLGGAGSLGLQAYLNSSLRIGGEIGGMFALSPNLNALLAASFLAKATYTLFSFYPFEVPVSLGAGISIVKYQDASTIDPLLKPGVSLFWIFNSSWSFGLNAAYWWDMQFATDPSRSRVGNFLEISVSALYHY
jgi:hypothetical protein